MNITAVKKLFYSPVKSISFTKSEFLNVLKDKGIDATLKLTESPNSKVVIVGSGKSGMPLILGN